MAKSPFINGQILKSLKQCLAGAGVLVLLSGCSSIFRPVNEPITEVDVDSGYRLSNRKERGDTHMIVAFSGGGTRAAALSYGVMQELRDTSITSEGLKISVLDEVDTISSVSGGSFTAAYYGVFGDKLFENYEEDFLRQSVQSSLMRRLFSPGHWLKSLFTGFDRTEMAVDYYDRTIFKGATFADIPLDKRPFIRINSTDLASGQRFDFVQSRFDLLCSDLGEFPIARAVTASSAVPVAFPSVVLENHADQCDVSETKAWKLLNKVDRSSSNQVHVINNLKSYRDVDQRPYIHLVDGGISDNLGLRVVIELLDNFKEQVYGSIASSPPKNIVIVLVNAEARPDRIIEQTAAKPSVGATIGAVSNAQIARYNLETRLNLKAKLDEMQRLAEQHGLPTKIYFSEVSFNSIMNQDISRFFNNLPTSLELDDGDIDTLIDSARILLRQEPEFIRFVSDNKGKLADSEVSSEYLCQQIKHSSCQ